LLERSTAANNFSSAMTMFGWSKYWFGLFPLLHWYMCTSIWHLYTLYLHIRTWCSDIESVYHRSLTVFESYNLSDITTNRTLFTNYIHTFFDISSRIFACKSSTFLESSVKKPLRVSTRNIKGIQNDIRYLIDILPVSVGYS